ncbi:hypothetical protein LTR02_009225 [Friedmanniomyces endolithicus]|nr:hypothetical protein LTR75_015435 [Friedmanniomyces endolithicus]KAK0855226.1 hypothetical protein LTR03_001992 [Friedmanniomyces endolithicus]KAK0859256.1 hypothetical protein LTS02_009343 [Friedmanniomyces endolithicus]KAK0874769.1 hypothetical protein LTR87_011405 [Friedmanniomyces endolithicus]KAK0900349.1 hypothetical protein LTR02_009225 [Friedmanniomyces endolithicus]
MGSPQVLPKDTGSQWVCIYKGKEWPVVLCGDEIPPKLFLDTRKDRCDADQFLTNDASSAKTEELRRLAFRQDALEFQSAEYWQNFINNRGAIRKMEREETRTADRGRKRKREGESAESTDMSSPGSWSSLEKQSCGSRDQESKKRARLSAPLAIPSNEREGTQVSSNTLGPTGVIGPAKNQADDDPRSPFFKEELGHKLQKFREQHERSITGSPPKSVADSVDMQRRRVLTLSRPGGYTIFVGKEKVSFESTQDAVMQSQILSGRIKYTGALRTHVDISDITEVTPKDFVLVSEYLQHTDFIPRLIEIDDALPCLDGISLPKQRIAAAEKCASVFRTASYLQLAGLEFLCVNKLKVLYPLDPLCLLIVTRIFARSVVWGCEAETELIDWLIDHITEYYWLLSKKHGGLLVEVLHSSDEIRERVLQNVIADPKMGRRGLDEE